MGLPAAVIKCTTKEERDELFEILKNENIRWSTGGALSECDRFPELNCYIIPGTGEGLLHSDEGYFATKDGTDYVAEEYDVPRDVFLISLEEYKDLMNCEVNLPTIDLGVMSSLL